MKRIVTMDIEEYIMLPSEIAHAIIESSKKVMAFVSFHERQEKRLRTKWH
jgi:hypothetical protein